MDAHAYWNPWRELARFQADMNQLFNWDARANTHQESLPIRLWVGEEGAVLTVLVPGVQPDSLDVTVLGETLTLRGRRTGAPAEETGVTFHRRERALGEFSRPVELPFRVDPQKVVARYNQGVLELLLPRSAADKPQRITVKAS